MIIFKNPQDPFTDREFIEILRDYVKINYIHDCPTFNGKTFFWSTNYYQDIKRQYRLDGNNKNKDAHKLFFLKLPESYQAACNKYSKNFRNAVNKSKKNHLILEIIDKPSIELLNNCYRIYQENMNFLRTFSFSSEFFQKLCGLSYSRLWLIKKDNQIISFALMLGNLMFIQSSNHLGKENCANNFLYDSLLKKMENNYIFFGVASKNNSGLFKFKLDAGLDTWLANETQFDIFQHLPVFFRDNFIAWYFLKFINKDKIIKYCLPY